MVINKIKINGYGNIQNKEIDLGNNINIIYGKNEAGKSTLVNYFKNTLYGISKTKDGKEISDYEKYLPWSGDEYSGKIGYSLDDGSKYFVYRDFKKNKIQIVDKFGKEITDEFNIDKNRNNLFFAEQTNINKELFEMTFMSAQSEVKIDKQKQSQIVQKISNLVETGNEVISYKKAIEKINKRQNDEIGTGKTRGRPINILDEKLQQCQRRLDEIEEEKIDTIMENEEVNYDKEILFAENMQSALNEFKELLRQEESHNEKINLNEEVQNVNNSQIQTEKEKLEKIINNGNIIDEKMEINNHKYIAILIVTIVLSSAVYIISSNIIISLILILIVCGILFLNYSKSKSYVDRQKESSSRHEQNIEIHRSKIQVLQANNNEIKKVIQELDLKYESKINAELECWKNKYMEILGKEEIEFIFEKVEMNNVDGKIIVIQNKLNDLRVSQNKATYESQTNEIIKMEKNTLREEINCLKIQKEKMTEDYQIMEEAKVILSEAYHEMRNKVTPFLVEEVSKHIRKISNGKYSTVRLTEADGIIVEGRTGEYLPMSKLSIGTTDQLHLALRLATINSISNERVPLFFDETFVYFDDKRLENTLKHMEENCENRQIFIFTCSRREINILSRLGIEYNLVEI